ncbi:hypothetical protein PENTCL1PPCAC_23915, partial [Pristionchus entomophagus]
NEGIVSATISMLITTMCDMDIALFPYDQQSCSVCLFVPEMHRTGRFNMALSNATTIGGPLEWVVSRVRVGSAQQFDGAELLKDVVYLFFFPSAQPPPILSPPYPPSLYLSSSLYLFPSLHFPSPPPPPHLPHTPYLPSFPFLLSPTSLALSLNR